MKNIFIIAALIVGLSSNSYALVGLGGYVPFGPSTQKDPDGGRNTFSFDPMVTFNTVQPIPGFNHVFMPELGFVFHGSGSDDYKKTTTFLLLDVGYLIRPKLVLRYGIGTFITSVKGDGGAVELNNGTSTSTFYRPGESKKSWNTTLDLGAEMALAPNYALRFQTHLFSIFSSTSRKLSYSLSFNYYL